MILLVFAAHKIIVFDVGLPIKKALMAMISHGESPVNFIQAFEVQRCGIRQARNTRDC